MVCSGMRRNQATPSFSVRRSFRLPGLLPPRKPVKIERDATSTSRVVTYLPPPMNHSSLDGSIHPPVSRSSDPVSQVQDEEITPTIPSSSMVATSYPSPSRTRISRTSKVRPDKRANQDDKCSLPVLALAVREQGIEPYHPPSPPTSDPPVMSSQSADVRIQVDLRVIRDKITEVKRTIRKVFLFYLVAIQFGFACAYFFNVCMHSCDKLPFHPFGDSKTLREREERRSECWKC
jgi:hypothetical protein